MRCFPLLCSATVCLSLTGCSLQEHLSRAEARLEKQYAEARSWDELPLRTISWEQALAILRRSNAELLAAQQAIEHAERETLSVYTDMIPSVTYYSYANKAVADLTRRWSRDDMQENLNVNFHIPTLTQVPYRVYAAQAQAYAATKAKEGKEREVISKLYQLIRRRELAERKQALEQQKPDQQTTVPALADTKATDTSYWADTAKLLGDYSARWNILPETMPHLRWQSYRNRLDRLDPLLVCQFAMKLEQARLAQYGVAMQYLPSINTSLYSPSLFSSMGGTYSGTFLSSHDTKLNLGLNYDLDTRLRTWDRYQNSKDAYERTKLEVAAAIIEHKDKVATLRRSMDDYDAWRSYMNKRADYLRTAPAETAADFLTHRKELTDMEREELMQEEQGIETEAALVLEYGMPE
ncbi:MAG: hypothetical protein MJ051_07875 [Akkermansia sp.]|nr:hypothetical protein [Akkermansia sp.]